VEFITEGEYRLDSPVLVGSPDGQRYQGTDFIVVDSILYHWEMVQSLGKNAYCRVGVYVRTSETQDQT